MYSINLEPSDEQFPVIDRSMSSNTANQLIPVIVEICRTKYSMANPVALFIEDGVYRVFDLDNPSTYAKISIIKDAN